MANVDNGNTIYLDSTGAISNTRGLVIKHVIITPTAASASLILRDQATGTPTKLRIDIAAAGNPLHIPLGDAGMLFPTGIDVGTITNCVVTLVYIRR